MLRTLSQNLQLCGGSRNFVHLALATSSALSSLSFACKMQSRHSSSGNAVVIPVVEYKEIKDLPNHPEKLLVDVREPKELIETGVIPTSINIPLSSVQRELAPKSDAKAFEGKYGRQKPGVCTELIFTCRSGKRAQDAALVAAELGYSNVKNYKGSWLDWAEHEGLN